MPFDVEPHRRFMLDRVLPAYDRLGALSFAFLQGSLVSGYTDASDLDAILVWAGPEVPTGREAVVADLDERRPDAPFVVDYQDVHLDRFTRAGQEYNLAHRTLAGIQEAVQAVAAGNGLDRVGILDPLVTVSGFCYGELLADAGGQGAALRTSLRPFPPRLQAELQRVLRSRHTAQLGDLDKFAQRADWLSFYSALVAAVRLVMQALFAMHGVYYPGDKWLRQALLRFGLDQRILAAYDRVWAPGVAAVERIAAYRELLSLAQA